MTWKSLESWSKREKKWTLFSIWQLKLLQELQIIQVSYPGTADTFNICLILVSDTWCRSWTKFSSQFSFTSTANYTRGPALQRAHTAEGPHCRRKYQKPKTKNSPSLLLRFAPFCRHVFRFADTCSSFFWCFFLWLAQFVLWWLFCGGCFVVAQHNLIICFQQRGTAHS